MVEGHWRRLATSSALLAVVVLLAGGLLALIGSTVFPQAGMFAWAAVVLLIFLLFQLVLFRVLGLRSRADERPAETRPAARGTGSGEHADDEVRAPALPRAALSDAGERAHAAAHEGAGDTEASDDRDWRAWRG